MTKPDDTVSLKAEEMVDIACAFCRGTGKDPFNLMSPISTCQVCGGKGWHRLQPPTVVCPFCSGSGVHPQSRMTCTVCGGIGSLSRPTTATGCPECGGTGRSTDAGWPGSPFPCSTCNGKGFAADYAS